MIGITGKKGSGKDAIGQILTEEFGYRRYAFADSLKSICKELFGFNHEQLHGNLKEEKDSYWGVSPREVLQFVGSELFRDQMSTLIPSLGKDFWVRSLERKLVSTEKICVTDVRFENEAEMVRSLGGRIIKVVRPCLVSQDEHQSENAEIEADLIVVNDGTLEDLRIKLLEQLP